MHHQIRVTDEQDGQRTYNGTYAVPEYALDIKITYSAGGEKAILAAFESAATDVLAQIAATNREKAPE